MEKKKAATRAEDDIRERLKALQKIAAELITRKDLKEALKTIVNKAAELLHADAASLYLKNNNENTLTFEIAMNSSIDIPIVKRSIPISDKGIANYVFKSGQAVNIPDVSKIPHDAEYSFDNSFDKKFHYHTRSILAYPLKSSKGVLLGVIQIINRKNSFQQKWPLNDEKSLKKMPGFTDEDSLLLESFTGVASSAIENSFLYQEIENLFEGFVKASVHAIESRDPTTSGHSERVAALTVDLANNSALFNEQGIAEIRYASLLHDFGKIAVKETTLLKEEKLLPLQKLAIQSRFKEFKNATEISVMREFIERLIEEGRAPNELEWHRLQKEISDFGLSIEDAWNVVQELNLPTVLNQDRTDKLKRISHVHCKDCEGNLKPLLEKDEIYNLSILKGSLTNEERLEIESHVVHTVEFLKKIPWAKKFSQVTTIASAHHEKLNGKGYPKALRAEEIPVQSRMMTICDIFDALVASDRPYKKALPLEKALDILSQEVKDGSLDANLFKIFLDGKSWECKGFTSLVKSSIKKAA